MDCRQTNTWKFPGKVALQRPKHLLLVRTAEQVFIPVGNEIAVSLVEPNQVVGLCLVAT